MKNAGEHLYWLKATPLDINTNNPTGPCVDVNSYCFQVDPTTWTANCQRYRLTFYTPCDQPTGTDFWMRFRLGYATCPMTYDGPEAFGEVEDVVGTDPDLFELDCDAQTPVELISFEAETTGRDVTLSWVTGSELDNAGFNLLRATSESGPYAKINPALIPAEGSPDDGASYSYVDRGLARGTYFYKLEAVDIFGNSNLYGPVKASVLTPQFGCGMVY